MAEGSGQDEASTMQSYLHAQAAQQQFQQPQQQQQYAPMQFHIPPGFNPVFYPPPPGTAVPNAVVDPSRQWPPNMAQFAVDFNRFPGHFPPGTYPFYMPQPSQIAVAGPGGPMLISPSTTYHPNASMYPPNNFTQNYRRSSDPAGSKRSKPKKRKVEEGDSEDSMFTVTEATPDLSHIQHMQVGIKEDDAIAEEAASTPTPAISTSGNKFLPGDLIWARLGRHPHWPGEVIDPDARESLKRIGGYKPGYLLVHFFGTHDYAYVPPNFSVDFHAQYKDKHRKSRGKQFLEAIQEINDYIATGKAPDGWTDDVAVEKHGNYLFQSEQDQSHGLLSVHSGFVPVQRPKRNNTLKSRKRREHQLQILRKLVLVAPESV